MEWCVKIQNKSLSELLKYRIGHEKESYFKNTEFRQSFFFVAGAGFHNVKSWWVTPCCLSGYFGIYFIAPSVLYLSAHRFCTAV